METEQLGFFDIDFEGEIDDNEKPSSTNGINVVFADFKTAKNINWRELMAGFDRLCVLTYSSSIGFARELTDMFSYAEIVFGCKEIMSNSFAEIAEFQRYTIEMLQKSKDKERLISRVNNGSLKLYIENGHYSHDKLYLLSSEDGRKRVVTGSANASERAFTGGQKEGFQCFDGEEAYNYYLESYNRYKETCSSSVEEKAFAISTDIDSIDELPIAGTVKANKVLAVVPNDASEEDKADIEFAINLGENAQRYKNILNVYKPKNDTSGRTAIDYKALTEAKILAKKEIERKKINNRQFPQLVVDVDSGNASLNGKGLDLKPSTEAIATDVELLLDYFDGYNHFVGDVLYMQSRYFAVANWLFCSPFMSLLRNTALDVSDSGIDVKNFPVYGVIYGKASGGKSNIIMTIQKMMLGQMIDPIDNDSFTKSYIQALKGEGLKRNKDDKEVDKSLCVKGIPILVDDISKGSSNKWTYLEDLIKADFWGKGKHYNYPLVVFTCNKNIKSIPPELAKRAVIVRSELSLSLDAIKTLERKIKDIQNNIGTAFYREYLRRMLPYVKNIVNNIRERSREDIDILNISSEVVIGIIKEYGSNIPPYICKLTHKDYISDTVLARYPISYLSDMWSIYKHDETRFIVNVEENILWYISKDKYEVERLAEELPKDLSMEIRGESLKMKLDTACEVFKINFAAERGAREGKQGHTAKLKSKIRLAWIENRKSFKVVKKKNELWYNTRSNKIAQIYYNNMPDSIKLYIDGAWVIMRLDEAKRFFGIDFKSNFIDAFRT